MSLGAEYSEVEKPLLDQLLSLGWQHFEGDKYDPSLSNRHSFRDVLLEQRLRAKLLEINAGPDGQPWLDDSRLSEAVSSLTRSEPGSLIEINERMTERLLEGVSVAGLPGWDQGRSQRVKFIDWDNPDRNEFLAINQFRADEPGGQAKKFVAPDVVLFVNGIPLVVIECKSPYITDPMAEGINQLRRYANQRDLGPEGNEQLFWTNQFVISTYGDRARVATFTAGPEHFLEWKDCAPLSKDVLAKQLGKTVAEVSGQELLAAGMLTPATLLDLVRHYTLFTEVAGRRVKIVARYQQYRVSLSPWTGCAPARPGSLMVSQTGAAALSGTRRAPARASRWFSSFAPCAPTRCCERSKSSSLPIGLTLRSSSLGPPSCPVK
jgi:type I restriction enzyme, R subunit